MREASSLIDWREVLTFERTQPNFSCTDKSHIAIFSRVW